MLSRKFQRWALQELSYTKYSESFLFAGMGVTFHKNAANTETVNTEWWLTWDYMGYVPRWQNKTKCNFIEVFERKIWPNYHKALGNGLKNFIIFSCSTVFKNSFNSDWYATVTLAICLLKIRLRSIDWWMFIKKSPSSFAILKPSLKYFKLNVTFPVLVEVSSSMDCKFNISTKFGFSHECRLIPSIRTISSYSIHDFGYVCSQSLHIFIVIALFIYKGYWVGYLLESFYYYVCTN